MKTEYNVDQAILRKIDSAVGTLPYDDLSRESGELKYMRLLNELGVVAIREIGGFTLCGTQESIRRAASTLEKIAKIKLKENSRK